METTEQSSKERIPNGAGIAALLAAMIGMLALGVIAFACEMSKPLATTVHGIGKLWMPGAEGIGPYSGKETVALLAWLASWPILHFLQRKRQLVAGFWLIIFLVGVGLATTLIWPPIWHLFEPAH